MTPALSAEMTMSELLEQLPGAQRALFRQYHIGGCSSCSFQPTETLGQVCQRNDNLNVDEVIGYLLQSHEEDLKVQIAPKELLALLEADPSLRSRLVDIRTREEFDAVHIEGSHLFTQELMQEIQARWERNRPLILVDHQGKRSLDAAAYFAGHGFPDVRALRGGIDAWSEEADPSLPRYEIEPA